ncbi:unnamed protein product, partial [Discosporangium mesarthrocarpum]
SLKVWHAEEAREEPLWGGFHAMAHASINTALPYDVHLLKARNKESSP